MCMNSHDTCTCHVLPLTATRARVDANGCPALPHTCTHVINLDLPHSASVMTVLPF